MLHRRSGGNRAARTQTPVTFFVDSSGFESYLFGRSKHSADVEL
jgi:hypothetical protein